MSIGVLGENQARVLCMKACSDVMLNLRLAEKSNCSCVAMSVPDESFQHKRWPLDLLLYLLSKSLKTLLAITRGRNSLSLIC